MTEVNDEQILRASEAKAPDISGTSVNKQDVESIKNLMYVLVIVLFIGFAQMFVAVGGLLIDSWTNDVSSYKELENKVDLVLKQTQITPVANQSSKPIFYCR